jgi:hypothetical protein
MSKDKDKKHKDKAQQSENDDVTKEDLHYEDDGRLLLDAAKRGNVALMEELIKGSFSRSLGVKTTTVTNTLILYNDVNTHFNSEQKSESECSRRLRKWTSSLLCCSWSSWYFIS